MGRKEDSFWEHAERLNGNRFKCKYCGRDFAGGIVRFKSHLSGIKGRDIEICTKVPTDVQLTAAGTIKGVHRAPKTEAFSSNSDETTSEICETNGSSVPHNLLAKLILLYNIDPGVVKSPVFIDFVNSVASDGPSFNLPSVSTLETELIPSLFGEVRAHVSRVKDSWGDTGATLVSDLWCDDKENRCFLNITAHSPRGLVLLHSLEISKDKLTSDFLEVIVSFAIQTVRANNVVQYINGVQSVGLVGSLLAEEYPHIYITRCVAAEIQSLFEEVHTNIGWVRQAFDTAKCLVTRIYGRDDFLSIVRKYTNNNELIQPQLREFSSNYDMLRSIIQVRDELLQFVQSTEWLSIKGTHESGQDQITVIIQNSEFWNLVQQNVLALESLRDVLNVDDRYGSSCGYLYEVMERATDKIRRIYNVDPAKYQRFWDIFQSRKKNIVQPIHQAAAFLNPACEYTDMFIDAAKRTEVINFVVRSLADDEDIQAFKKQMEDYSKDIAKRVSRTSNPYDWRDSLGHKHPLLKKHAIRILSQPCSSLACKQSLSAFKSAQMKQQQRFSPEASSGHLFLKMNMILTTSFAAKRTSGNDTLNGGVITRVDLQPSHRSGYSSEQYPSQKYFQLLFITRISPSQVIGQEIKGNHGSVIHVFLVDPVTGDVVQDERFSMLKLRVSALQGDFGEEATNDWKREDFEGNDVMDATHMTGDLQVTLHRGMGTIGPVTFHSSSSSTRNGKFKLGAKADAAGDIGGVRIREGLSNAFVVENPEDRGRHDGDVEHIPCFDDSWQYFDIDQVWSALQNNVGGDSINYNQSTVPEWNAEGTYIRKQNSLRRPRAVVGGWPWLRATILPWIRQRRIVKKKRAQRMTVWDPEVAHEHKQDGVKLKGVVRWLKLKAILQWGMLRRLTVRKRAQRMVLWTQVQNRLDEWSKGAEAKTTAGVERHANKYFHWESRLGIDTEMEELLKPHQKQERERINKLTDSHMGEPPKFSVPDIPESGPSSTLLLSLLTRHGAENTEDEESEKQSEPMKSANSNAGQSAPPNPGTPHPLTLFPSLLTGGGDKTIKEEPVMDTEPEPVLSTGPADNDELNARTTLGSVTAKQIHHWTANKMRILDKSAPSSKTDREISWRPPHMPDDGMRQFKCEDKRDTSAQGSESPFRNEVRPSSLSRFFEKRKARLKPLIEKDRRGMSSDLESTKGILPERPNEMDQASKPSSKDDSRGNRRQPSGAEPLQKRRKTSPLKQ